MLGYCSFYVLLFNVGIGEITLCQMFGIMQGQANFHVLRGITAMSMVDNAYIMAFWVSCVQV